VREFPFGTGLAKQGRVWVHYCCWLSEKPIVAGAFSNETIFFYYYPSNTPYSKDLKTIHPMPNCSSK
jgi:hypothetical protein